MSLKPRKDLSTVAQREDGQSLILVGVDGSDKGWRALHYAIGVRRNQPGRLVAMHAVQIPAYALVSVDSFGFGADSIYYALDGAHIGVGEIAQGVRGLGRECGLAVEFVWVDDSPAAAIIRAASAYRADLVVIGSSGAARRRFHNSTEASILRSCLCPVTVVP